MIQCGNQGQDAARFRCGENDRELELGIGAGQFQLARPDPLERLFPKDLDGADGLGGGLAGDFLYGLEMDAILANLLG
jgi:hypothetical protein